MEDESNTTRSDDGDSSNYLRSTTNVDNGEQVQELSITPPPQVDSPK